MIFVSYGYTSCDGYKHGSGYVVLDREPPKSVGDIASMQDIITESLRDQSVTDPSVVILNWKRLGE